MTELFKEAEIVSRAPNPPIPANEFPYHIVGYWPRNNHGWSIQTHGWSSPDNPRLKEAIDVMSSNGWLHVHVIKLPDYKP